MQPTIISYRFQKDQSSHFLNVEDLLKTEDSTKILQVYNSVFSSITAYVPNHVENLLSVENKLFTRSIELKNKELEGKNLGWKALGLSFMTLGARPLILSIKMQSIKNEINQLYTTHKKFSHAFKQMKYRSEEKTMHPKLEALRELEKLQLRDPEQELIRLKSLPRIAKSLEMVGAKLTQKHQIAFGRSLELREKLKDTHYVINHGQNLDLMLVNMITRKLKQEFEPHYYESFEPMRHDTALLHIKEDTHTVAWYKKLISKGRIHDQGLKNSLLSGDCFLESTKNGESALDFFAGSINVGNRNGDLLFVLLLTIVKYYITDDKVAKKLCYELADIMPKYSKGGNLYSIFVPKERFDESCYFSKPYGVPFKNQKEIKSRMEEMQSGVEIGSIPQIRVLTHKIRPEDGYHVILNSTLTSDELQEIDNEVTLCLQAALAGPHLFDNPQKNIMSRVTCLFKQLNREIS